MDKKFPDLKLLEKDKDGSRLSRELTSTFQRLYDIIDDLERKLSTKIEEESKLNVQRFSDTSTLVNSFATSLLGVTNPPNPLSGLGMGTVTNITFNSAFVGGSITGSGSVSLVIGSVNTIQKSDGVKLIDSLIEEIGFGVWLKHGGLIKLGSNIVATVDDNNQLFILNIAALPVADPGTSGALWNNLGVINVSP